VYSTVLRARNLRIALKNLLVLPKAIYQANVIQHESVVHIHAHWGATTATIAYIVSLLTGIPWSFTLHRRDITANNLLKLKVQSAQFARCISKHGKNMLLERIGSEYGHKIHVIPMGVSCDNTCDSVHVRDNPFTIAVPANLFLVKGHRYFIEACAILRERGIKKLHFIFYGDGYLKK
jgi:glycosyltransferase involved in cell wall biosynthesis